MHTGTVFINNLANYEAVDKNSNIVKLYICNLKWVSMENNMCTHFNY